MTRLAVDFGTSHTVAVLDTGDGSPPQSLLFGDSPLLPSAVCAEVDGPLLAGRNAVRAARINPARFEPSPKQRIDDGTVLLGERDVPVAELIAAVLRVVATEAERVAGAAPSSTVLTHPAAWSHTRRGLLLDAAVTAGLPEPALLPEPVAAARYFSADLPPASGGDTVVVYDFGGGTFDLCVLNRNSDGFQVLDEAGLNDVGGNDIDMAMFNHIGAGLPESAQPPWQQLARPVEPASMRARMLLMEDIRLAKQQLGQSARTDIHVPLLDRDVMVTREEFETLARPFLDRTVELTAATLRKATAANSRPAGVFLVGGSSRIPLVNTLLHRSIGIAPTVVGQPEQVVARGALIADAAGRTGAPAPAAAPASVPVAAAKTAADGSAASRPPASSLSAAARQVKRPPKESPTRRPPKVRPVVEEPPAAKPRRWGRIVGIAVGVVVVASFVALYTFNDIGYQARFSSEKLAAFAGPWLNDVQECGQDSGASHTMHYDGEVVESHDCAIDDEVVVGFVEFADYSERSISEAAIRSHPDVSDEGAYLLLELKRGWELYWYDEESPSTGVLSGEDPDRLTALWQSTIGTSVDDGNGQGG